MTRRSRSKIRTRDDEVRGRFTRASEANWLDAALPVGYLEPGSDGDPRSRAPPLLHLVSEQQPTSMQDDPRETAARRAIDAGDWPTARELYEALARETNAPEAWARLAEAAWLQQDSRLMIDARLTAYRLHRERGNDVAAARMAIALGNDFLDFRGDAAVANGWFKYARRLLKPLPPSAEHARLNVWEARLALIGRQDVAEGVRLAEESLRLARDSNCPDVEVLATALNGLALVMNAQPARGLALLDEAAAAALAGDISDPYAAGLTCCYLISACDRIRDYDRAAQWCARLREFSSRQRFAILMTTCRLQYGSVLISRGAWAEAEAELQAAIVDLREARPIVLPAAHARLGELRRRQGRTDEAVELFEQAGSHPLALLGGACVDIEHGNLTRALERAGAYLRRFPEDALLERAPANELLVRIAAASGKPADAQRALAELEKAAQKYELPLLRAAVLSAKAILSAAEGNDARAAELMDDAAALYDNAGFVHEAATARSVLQKKPRSGAAVPNAPLTQREMEVLRLVAKGLSEREVADKLFISHHTAHRHLSNIRHKLNATTQAAAVALAVRIGLI
jgi:LuxR family maltose regulon positive regulatory protein